MVKKMSEKNNNKSLNDSGKLLMKRRIRISLPVLVLAATLVILLIQLSGYPGTMDDTQLGFNAEIIKVHFTMTDITLFILANLADYVFMVAYGCLFYSSAKYLSRNYQKGSIPRKLGSFFALVGLVTAICDATENIFLISMAIDPVGFPSWLAIAHSTFAFLKFILMYLTVGWLLLSFVLNRIPATFSRINGKVPTDPLK